MKVTHLPSGHHRDEDGQFQCNFFHKVESGSQWRSPAMPYRSPAMAAAYSPLLSPLPRTRIGGECSCMVEWNSKEAHPEDEGGVQ